MKDGEQVLFMKLATATKIYTQYEISDEDVNRAQQLMQEYLLGFKKVMSLICIVFFCLWLMELYYRCMEKER